MILNIVDNAEKLHARLIRFCITISSRFAMSVTHNCIFIALALSQYKYLMGRFCLSCLKRLSLASCLRIYNIVEHNDRMLPCIIVLYIPLTTGVTTDFKNSCLVTQIK